MNAPSATASIHVGRQRPVRTILLHQIRYDLRRLWRNPHSRFFTLGLPVLLLLVFGSVFHSATVQVTGGEINESVYYVPGILAFGLVAAVFMDLTVGLVSARESGIAKRRSATPAPAAAVLAGRVAVATLTGLAIVVVLTAVGWGAYGASVPLRAAPVVVLDVVVGTVAFCCLAVAAATFIRTAEAAQPVVQALILPLCFISGVFIPAGELPSWLIDISGVFPVRRLGSALLAPYNPHTTGSALRLTDVLILAAWGAVGLVIAWHRLGDHRHRRGIGSHAGTRGGDRVP
jgi:ABC-2 type transport system permease protein